MLHSGAHQEHKSTLCACWQHFVFSYNLLYSQMEKNALYISSRELLVAYPLLSAFFLNRRGYDSLGISAKQVLPLRNSISRGAFFK